MTKKEKEKIDKLLSQTLGQRKCPVCKKTFFCRNREEWCYHLNGVKHNKIVCSWHCQRASEKTSTVKHYKQVVKG